MHLTLQLLKSAGGAGRLAQGNIWTGKHRMAHGVYPRNVRLLKKTLRIEEDNLFYLRHPYLTFEQERGHAIELKKAEKRINYLKIWDSTRKMEKSVQMEQHLLLLNDSVKWEL